MIKTVTLQKYPRGTDHSDQLGMETEQEETTTWYTLIWEVVQPVFPFATVTAFALLGLLYTRYWNIEDLTAFSHKCASRDRF